jgi:hypothetical protein
MELTSQAKWGGQDLVYADGIRCQAQIHSGNGSKRAERQPVYVCARQLDGLENTKAFPALQHHTRESEVTRSEAQHCEQPAFRDSRSRLNMYVNERTIWKVVELDNGLVQYNQAGGGENTADTKLCHVDSHTASGGRQLRRRGTRACMVPPVEPNPGS